MPMLPSTDAPRGEVELVVDAEHFRRVVLGGILQARTSLDISTADFKAMLVPGAQLAAIGGTGGKRGPGGGGSGGGSGGRRGFRNAVSIVHVLRSLTERGVEVRLLHSGVPSGPAMLELKRELPTGLTIRRCPRLHAKAVVVDAQWMYMGSANLTGAGLGAKAEHRRNIEWGICTRSPALIDAIMAQFNSLWEGRRCEKCQRRQVCPVPLEEPRL